MSIKEVKIFDIDCDKCGKVVRIESRHHGLPSLPDGWRVKRTDGYEWHYCPECKDRKSKL